MKIESMMRGAKNVELTYSRWEITCSRPDTDGAGNAAYRQVWDVAQNLLKNIERDLRQPDAVGKFEQPSDGDRPDIAGERRTHVGGYGTF